MNESPTIAELRAIIAAATATPTPSKLLRGAPKPTTRKPSAGQKRWNDRGAELGGARLR